MVHNPCVSDEWHAIPCFVHTFVILVAGGAQQEEPVRAECTPRVRSNARKQHIHPPPLQQGQQGPLHILLRSSCIHPGVSVMLVAWLLLEQCTVSPCILYINFKMANVAGRNPSFHAASSMLQKGQVW